MQVLARLKSKAQSGVEALVFAIERTDIEKAMKNYRYGGYYGNVIRHLKQIVEQRCTE